MTMLDVLRERLVDGLEISKVKEKPSKFEIEFTFGGIREKSELPKSCTPGMHNRVADRTIFNAMAGFALRRNDPDDAKFWLDKVLGLGRGDEEERE